jgi:hypothetical protein
MMRTCPKCGDYYGDAPSAFCLSDGTPLAEVDPHGEAWGEATRVVLEKARVLRKLERRLKLRRLLTRMVTLLVVCLVVCVAAFNSYFYLRPAPEGDVWARMLTPGPWPTPVPAPTLEPMPSPGAKTTPTATPVCTDDDKGRASAAVKADFGGAWLDDMRRDCEEIIVENTPPVVRRARPKPGAVGFTFSKSCARVVVNVNYKCVGEGRVNGKVEAVSVSRKKRVECRKAGRAWLCG